MTPGGEWAFTGIGVAVEHEGDIARLAAQLGGTAGCCKCKVQRAKCRVFESWLIGRIGQIGRIGLIGGGGIRIGGQVEAATGGCGGNVADEGVTVGEDAGGEPLDVEGEEVGDAACGWGRVLDDDAHSYGGVYRSVPRA